ncbi:MAG: DUF3577 domain-containing protein [Gammaproteobacteria bacterium]|nr:DUF3577 domain-containing protein [Gammaproteobacteria bacterium]
MTNNTQNNETPKKAFFDLHTSGIGYLNRARTVTPNNGDPYESVSIAGLHGRSDNPSYSYFDTSIVGEDAADFVTKHKATINDRNSKVLVRFKVGDGNATSYEVKSGQNKGQRNHLIKCRLLQITWASINGEVVLKPAESDQQGQDTESAEQQPAEQLPTSVTPSVPTLKETYVLDQNDPDFMPKRKWLIKQGYQYDSLNNVWCLTKNNSEAAA